MIQLSQIDIERFKSHITKQTQSQYIKTLCLEMDIFKNKDGYHIFRCDGKSYVAHRIAYQIYYGHLNPKMQINHICNNPSCVNPLHLEEGTSLSNKQYEMKCDRHCKGEKHGMTKLTDNDVYAILTDIWNDKYKNVNEIISKYNITTHIIWKILTGKTWTHITNQLQIPLVQIAEKVMYDDDSKRMIGSKNGRAVINEKLLEEIKSRIEKNEITSVNQISKEYHLKNITVQKIFHGDLWKHITRNWDLEYLRSQILFSNENRQYGEKNKNAKLTENDVLKIRSEISIKSIKQLTEEYNIGKTTLRNIIQRNTWKHI
jgi:hypothetical protein